jgi:hypothetical protein
LGAKRPCLELIEAVVYNSVATTLMIDAEAGVLPHFEKKLL